MHSGCPLHSGLVLRIWPLVAPLFVPVRLQFCLTLSLAMNLLQWLVLVMSSWWIQLLLLLTAFSWFLSSAVLKLASSKDLHVNPGLVVLDLDVPSAQCPPCLARHMVPSRLVLALRPRLQSAQGAFRAPVFVSWFTCLQDPQAQIRLAFIASASGSSLDLSLDHECFRPPCQTLRSRCRKTVLPPPV